MDKIQEINEYFQKGIEVKGEARRFDLIDLFLMYDRDTVINYLKFYKNGVYAHIAYYNHDSNQEKLIHATKIILGSKKDEFGNLIPGREITIEEKQAILSFMEENNIPTSDPLFMTALRKYLRGELELNVNRSLA